MSDEWPTDAWPTSGSRTICSGTLRRAGTPAIGGAVYVRVATPAAGKPIGGIEAAADGANTIAVTGATFMNAGDANGNVEIAYNI